MSAPKPKTTRSRRPLLLDAKEVGDILGRSDRSIWRDNEAGRIPAPITLGGAVRWRRNEIRAWVKAGCPPRGEWEGRWPMRTAGGTARGPESPTPVIE